MPAPWTLTAPTDILSSITNANTITGQWFGGLLILAIFSITFIGLKMYATEKALLVAGILTFISSTLLIGAELVTPVIIGLPLLLIAVGFFVDI